MNMYLFPHQWWRFIDPLVSTLLLLSTIGCVQKTGLLTPSTSNHSKSLFGASFIVSTGIKTINHVMSFHDERFIAKLIDVTADIIMMPATCNLWSYKSNAIAYGLYLGFVIGTIPAYTSKISSELSKLIHHELIKPADLPNSCENDSHEHTLVSKILKSFTPAFVRGVVFFELNKILNHAPISAFIAGSIRSHMLDTSKDVSSMIFSVMVDGLNAAANRISFFKIPTPVDLIIEDSSRMLIVEFLEFFVRHSKFTSWLPQYITDNSQLKDNQSFEITSLSNDDFIKNITDYDTCKTEDNIPFNDIIDYSLINQPIMIAHEE